MRILTGAEQYLAEQAMPDLPREEAYQRMGQFLDAVQLQAQQSAPPAGPVAGVGTLIGLGVSALLSVGTAAVQRALAPRPETNVAPPPPPEVQVTDQIGRGGGVLSRSFGSSSIFNSLQQVATFEDFYPCIWANREELPEQANPFRPAGMYGGVSVQLGLVFSRIKAQSTNSIAQLIWVVGEGAIGGLMPRTLAFGNSPVFSYLSRNSRPTTGNLSSGAATLYLRPDGGRITSADVVFGLEAAEDPGNAENDGGPDVFSVPSLANQIRPDHSYASTPGDNEFGLYSPLPVHGMARKTPILESTIEFQLNPIDTTSTDRSGDPEDSPGALAAMYGRHLQFSLRSSVYEVNGATYGTLTEVAVGYGDGFKYRLSANTDGGDDVVPGTRIVYDGTNTDINAGAQIAEAQQSDIATTVAGIQKRIASAMSIGGLYRFGSAVAILKSADPPDNPFRSKIDENPVGNGITVDYTFQVVNAGTIGVSPLDYFAPSWSQIDFKPDRWFRIAGFEDIPIPDTFKTASTFPQGAKMADATVALERECLVFEINYTSNLWQVISAGFPALKGSPTMSEIASAAGQQWAGQVFTTGQKANVSRYRSGPLPTTYESRVSLFRIWIKRSGNISDAYTVWPATFAFKGKVQQPLNNTLRFVKSFTEKIYVYHEPISSWELRSNENTPDPIILLEEGIGTEQSHDSTFGIVVYFKGRIITRILENFRLNAVEPTRNLGLSWSDPAGVDSAMFDAMGAAAEWQPYGEATSSMLSSPENRVAGVNYITVYNKAFEYPNLAILGANVVSNPSLTSISQASITCIRGTRTTHLLPQIAEYRLLDRRYGLGDRINADNIDTAGFAASNAYCNLRRYFYDLQQGGVPDVLEWLDSAADQCLLEYGEINGKHTLIPALRFDPILNEADGFVGIFTASSDERESLTIETLPYEEILPIQVSVIYNELGVNNLEFNNPLEDAPMFVQERQLTVRRSSTPSSARVATFRLPACTNRYHAADYAMWKIRQREVQQRVATLVTFPSVAGVNLLFNFVRIYSAYFGQEDGVTGRVNDDGTITSTRPDLVTTGSHSIIEWDLTNPPASGTLTVDADGLGSPTGILFAFDTGAPYSTFQVRSVKLREDSMVEIKMVEYPLDGSGNPVLTSIWSNTYQSDASWTFIDGS